MQRTDLNIMKLNTTTTTTYSERQLRLSRTAKSGRMSEDEKTDTTEQSLTLAAAIEKVLQIGKNLIYEKFK